jgi:predicted ABC-type transport system involved in lysophospholipase L1 biosynthesis ATPase subunit
MGLFAELHAEGHTLIIVTHDPGIAAHCRRIIRLHDGRIVEDREKDLSGQTATTAHR